MLTKVWKIFIIIVVVSTYINPLFLYGCEIIVSRYAVDLWKLNWSIHTSRCIVVLDVLFDNYTTSYTYCNIHVKIRYNYTLFYMFLKSCVGFAPSHVLNVKKKKTDGVQHLESKIHKIAEHWALTNTQVYSIQHTRFKVMRISQMLLIMM